MTEIHVPKRRLGPNGIEVPVLALGSWNTWDRMGGDEAVAIIRRAAEVGAAFFDVAYYNMGPHSEQSRTDVLFGEAIRGAGLARSGFQVCGKLWLWEYPNLDFAGQMETSLDRAGLDRFDCVVVGDYRDRPDIARIVREVNAQIRAGHFDSWGINNWLIGDTLQALDVARDEGLVPPVFAQLKYGIARRTVAEGRGYGALFADGTLSLQASDCFEGGLLLHGDAPRRKVGADVGNIQDKVRAAAPRLREIAGILSATPVQVALAFALTHPATANVLFGVSKMSQFEDNLGALDLAARRGEEVRALCATLWLDKHVSPDGGF
jgi:aryl-alcohol dehydrogenase-like predicted oxidoreductase